jgi:hypothetical protein
MAATPPHPGSPTRPEHPTQPGRPTRPHQPSAPSRLALITAYVVVAACVVRLVAQVVADLHSDESTLLTETGGGAAAVVFAVGTALAGTLLPLALAHRWGRIWPGWVGPLAGRRVPRWLVLGPGLLVGAVITVYFGAGAVRLLVDPAGAMGEVYPLAYFLVVVPAYLIWGLGLLVLSVSYWAATRPPHPAGGNRST